MRPAQSVEDSRDVVGQVHSEIRRPSSPRSDMGIDSKPCCGLGANQLVSSRTTVAKLVTGEIQVPGEILTSLVVKWDCEVLTGFRGERDGIFCLSLQGQLQYKIIDVKFQTSYVLNLILDSDLIQQSGLSTFKVPSNHCSI